MLAGLCLVLGAVAMTFSGLMVYQGRKNLDVEEFESYTIPAQVFFFFFSFLFFFIVNFFLFSSSFFISFLFSFSNFYFKL